MLLWVVSEYYICMFFMLYIVAHLSFWDNHNYVTLLVNNFIF